MDRVDSHRTDLLGNLCWGTLARICRLILSNIGVLVTDFNHWFCSYHDCCYANTPEVLRAADVSLRMYFVSERRLGTALFICFTFADSTQSPELITVFRTVRQFEITHLTAALIGNILWVDCAKQQYYRSTAILIVSTKDQWRTDGGGLGVQPPPPPKFRRYRWCSRSHEQEEPASLFPFAVHCVLVRL